jgi:hypothetical protein
MFLNVFKNIYNQGTPPFTGVPKERFPCKKLNNKKRRGSGFPKERFPDKKLI